MKENLTCLTSIFYNDFPAIKERHGTQLSFLIQRKNESMLTGGGLRPLTAALNNSPACVGSIEGWNGEISTSAFRLTELR
jgi:hypothetical protein